MTSLNIIHIIICSIIMLRVLFYYKADYNIHRPIASAIAYLIVIGAGTSAIQALFFIAHPSISNVLLNFVLMLVVLTTKGNVAEMFYTKTNEHLIYNIIHDLWDEQGFHWWRIQPKLQAALKNLAKNLKHLIAREATS